MTDAYIIFDNQAAAQDAVDAVNILAGFPNEAGTQTVAEVKQGGTKWYVLIASSFPVEWFSGLGRLTKEEAEAAGIIFE
jgi:hypothetical protein